MILYCFPPLGGSATWRALGYVRHLISFGWCPHVVTVKAGASWEPKDESLLALIPTDIEVARTGFFDIRQPFIFLSHFPSSLIARHLDRFWAGFPPDRYIGWWPFAYRKAKEIITHQKIDAIFTFFPNTAHLVGYQLKRVTGLPWVADLGDEWSQNPFYQPMFAWQRKVNTWLERHSLFAADHITVAWPGLPRLLLAEGKRFTTLVAGFDANDFAAHTYPVHHDKFRITYTGSFYGPQQPVHFLSAMRELLDEELVQEDDIDLVFVGCTREAGSADFQSSASSKRITRVGFVSHGEAIQYMVNSDVLLLIVSAERGKENMPAKSFEYIASGRPILALVPPDGDAAELIRRTNTGVIVAPEDVEAIKHAILDLYAQWKAGRLRVHPNWEEISQYDQKEVAKKLAEVLDEVTGGR